MCHFVSTLLHSAIQPSITCDQVLNLRLFCWKWNYQFLISLWKWLVKSVCVHVTVFFSLLLLAILDDYRFLLLLNHQSRMNKQPLCVLFFYYYYYISFTASFGLVDVCCKGKMEKEWNWWWLNKLCFIKIVMYNIIRLYNTFKI